MLDAAGYDRPAARMADAVAIEGAPGDPPAQRRGDDAVPDDHPTGPAARPGGRPDAAPIADVAGGLGAADVQCVPRPGGGRQSRHPGPGGVRHPPRRPVGARFRRHAPRPRPVRGDPVLASADPAEHGRAIPAAGPLREDRPVAIRQRPGFHGERRNARGGRVDRRRGRDPGLTDRGAGATAGGGRADDPGTVHPARTGSGRGAEPARIGGRRHRDRRRRRAHRPAQSAGRADVRLHPRHVARATGGSADPRAATCAP